MPRLIILTERKIYKTAVPVYEHGVLHAKALSVCTFLLLTLCISCRKELSSTPYLPPTSQLILKAETAL